MPKTQLLVLIFLMLLIFTTIVACATPPSKPTPVSTPSTLEDVAARYKELKLLTTQPLIMDNLMLCRSLIAGLDTYVHGPENQPINVYSSQLGVAAMAEKGERTFPEGSIIIKEKLSLDGDNKPVGLGIMIKRSKGFNPEGGDWQYGYWEAGTLYTAKADVAQCQMCHVAGTVPPEWKEKYTQWGIALTEKARDSVYLTLP